MVNLNEFKEALLIEESNTEQDKLLEHVLKRAYQFICLYIKPLQYMDELDAIVESIAVKRYNRLKDEGILSKGIGVTVTYSNSLLTLEEKALLDKLKRDNATNLFFLDTRFIKKKEEEKE